MRTSYVRLRWSSLGPCPRSCAGVSGWVSPYGLAGMRLGQQDRRAVSAWLHHYNRHRYHTVLGGPPANCLSGQCI
jgi:hypothetical protein